MEWVLVLTVIATGDTVYPRVGAFPTQEACLAGGGLTQAQRQSVTVKCVAQPSHGGPLQPSEPR